MVINWTPTTGLKLSQIQSGSVHGPWAPSSGQQVQGNTGCCEMVVLCEVEFWSVEQSLIPNMWQLVFANVLKVKGWIIHTYEYRLLYHSSEVLWIPSPSVEIVDTGVMACDVKMFINRGSSFTKGFANSPIYSSLHSTLSHLYRYISTAIFWCDCVIILGATRRFLMVLPLWCILLSHVYWKCS